MTSNRRGDAVLLQNWFVRFRHADDRAYYLAPELNYKVIAGDVYRHPRFPDGHSVKTSRIVSVEGRRVTTSGGTVYLLGRIQPEYRAWLKKEGLKYNPQSPISIKDVSHG